MKLTIAIIACLAVGAYAGMIQYNDNDRFQWISFASCLDYDSLTIGISINSDTAYAERTYQVGDSLCIPQLYQVVSPDRDSRNRVIPGRYQGSYRYFVDSWLAGDRIASPDTIQVNIDYTVPGGCSVLPRID